MRCPGKKEQENKKFKPPRQAIALQRFDVLHSSRIGPTAIEKRHLVTLRECRLVEVRPDEPGAPGFHKTVLDEFYRVAFRKKLYHSIEELQRDLDAWLIEYNEQRSHQGRWCFGKTPMQTFLDTLPLAKEKLLSAAA